MQSGFTTSEGNCSLLKCNTNEMQGLCQVFTSVDSRIRVTSEVSLWLESVSTIILWYLSVGLSCSSMFKKIKFFAHQLYFFNEMSIHNALIWQILPQL